MSGSDDHFAHTTLSHRRPRTLALLVALTANALFAATTPAPSPASADPVLFPAVIVAATKTGNVSCQCANQN